MTMHSELETIAVDTETGGLHPAVNPLLSVAAVPSWDAEPLVIYVLPEPGMAIEQAAIEKNGYSPTRWAELGAVPLRRAMFLLTAQLQLWLTQKKGARLVSHGSDFDRPFLGEAWRRTEIEPPERYVWRCSRNAFGEMVDDGLLEPGSLSLDRLGTLSGFWQPDQRPSTHCALQDARACLHGYLWLREKRRAAARVPRTDGEIIAQTDRLAHTMLALSGYEVAEGYPFHRHAQLAEHEASPRPARAWEMARQAQILLTDTDPDDALPTD